ncbi:MAG: Maf family protein, partial [Acidobacteriota bacterium]|nr:Maf family protein [Acidobacteriota bacterium]
MHPRLILASASPRRRELLRNLGLEFLCRPVDLDETPLTGEAAEPYVRRLARAKAETVARKGEVVLAADTVVVRDGQLLGKPVDPDEARAMLASLSGRDHSVYTGVAIHLPPGLTRDAVCRSEVTMAPLSREEVDWYVLTGEPLDKAGAYAIQGLGALLVERIDGNYSNVVGLPLPTV